MGNTSARAITFLCTTVPNAKYLKELGTIEIHIIRKKRKISVQCFLTKFEVGKEKTIFIVIQFLLLPFLKKLISFPTLLLSTHTQSNIESSQHISVLHHGHYKHLKMPSTAQNYNNSMVWCFVKLIPSQIGNSKIITKNDLKFFQVDVWTVTSPTKNSYTQDVNQCSHQTTKYKFMIHYVKSSNKRRRGQMEHLAQKKRN